MARENGNLVSAVAASLAFNKNRTYLYIQCTAATMTIQIDSGASITLTAAGPRNTWEPRVVPQNALTISGTGIMVTG